MDHGAAGMYGPASPSASALTCVEYLIERDRDPNSPLLRAPEENQYLNDANGNSLNRRTTV